MQYSLTIVGILLGVLTGCLAVLIFTRNLRSVRGEIVTSAAPAPDTRIDVLTDKVRHLEDAVAVLNRRPEVTEYRDVLIRMEKAESAVRSNELRMAEWIESAKRTANKLAARASRSAPKAPPEPEPEEEEEPQMQFLPPPAVNGSQPQQHTRRFGRLT